MSNSNDDSCFDEYFENRLQYSTEDEEEKLNFWENLKSRELIRMFLKVSDNWANLRYTIVFRIECDTKITSLFLSVGHFIVVVVVPIGCPPNGLHKVVVAALFVLSWAQKLLARFGRKEAISFIVVVSCWWWFGSVRFGSFHSRVVPHEELHTKEHTSIQFEGKLECRMNQPVTIKYTIVVRLSVTHVYWILYQVH